MKLQPQRTKRSLRVQVHRLFHRFFRISASLIVVSGVFGKSRVIAQESDSATLQSKSLDTVSPVDSENVSCVTLDTSAVIDSLKAAIVSKKKELDSLKSVQSLHQYIQISDGIVEMDYDDSMLVEQLLRLQEENE